MSEKQPDILTHHAMLVAWGQFAQSIGMIRAMKAVTLHQKTVDHSPQTESFGVFCRHSGWIAAPPRTQPLCSSH